MGGFGWFRKIPVPVPSLLPFPLSRFNYPLRGSLEAVVDCQSKPVGRKFVGEDEVNACRFVERSHGCKEPLCHLFQPPIGTQRFNHQESLQRVSSVLLTDVAPVHAAGNTCAAIIETSSVSSSVSNNPTRRPCRCCSCSVCKNVRRTCSASPAKS